MGRRNDRGRDQKKTEVGSLARTTLAAGADVTGVRKAHVGVAALGGARCTQRGRRTLDGAVLAVRLAGRGLEGARAATIAGRQYVSTATKATNRNDNNNKTGTICSPGAAGGLAAQWLELARRAQGTLESSPRRIREATGRARLRRRTPQPVAERAGRAGQTRRLTGERLVRALRTGRRSGRPRAVGVGTEGERARRRREARRPAHAYKEGTRTR